MHANRSGFLMPTSLYACQCSTQVGKTTRAGVQVIRFRNVGAMLSAGFRAGFALCVRSEGASSLVVKCIRPLCIYKLAMMCSSILPRCVRRCVPYTIASPALYPEGWTICAVAGDIDSGGQLAPYRAIIAYLSCLRSDPFALYRATITSPELSPERPPALYRATIASPALLSE